VSDFWSRGETVGGAVSAEHQEHSLRRAKSVGNFFVLNESGTNDL